MEHHDTCDADRLIFTLPAVGDGVIYNTICGSTAPPPFSIPSYEAGVIFQSDDLGHGKFNMSYAVKECGGLVIDQLQGVITSPNYPQVCEVVSQVSLALESLALESQGAIEQMLYIF